MRKYKLFIRKTGLQLTILISQDLAPQLPTLPLSNSTSWHFYKIVISYYIFIELIVNRVQSLSGLKILHCWIFSSYSVNIHIKTYFNWTSMADVVLNRSTPQPLDSFNRSFFFDYSCQTPLMLAMNDLFFFAWHTICYGFLLVGFSQFIRLLQWHRSITVLITTQKSVSNTRGSHTTLPTTQSF